MKTGGSIRGLSLDGTPFDVMADAGLDEILSEFVNELIPTSGRPIRKMTKRVEEISGVILGTNKAEHATLKSYSDQLGEIKLSYTDAEGNTMKSQGTINIENNNTEENRTTISLLPSVPWVPFLA